MTKPGSMSRWTFVVLLCVVALLAACAAPATPATTAPAAAEEPAAAAPAGDKVQVKLATWAGVNEANELQAIIETLNAASTTYEIVQESSPAEYWTKLQTTVAANTAADLLWMDQEHLPDFAVNGALLDLTDALAASDKSAADLADYYPAALARYTVDERVYGLPWLAQPVMLYVNLDMLEAAGMSEEDVNNWAWADFLAACQAMTLDSAGVALGADGYNNADVTQYGFTLVPGWPPVQQFMWQAGGRELSEDLLTSPIDSPEAIAGANFVAQIATSGCAPEQSVISERGFDGMFKGGQVAMFMGGATDDHERTEGLRIKAFMLPQGPVSRENFAWIGGMSINAQTAIPDVATEAFLDLTQAIQAWKVPAPRISMANAESIVAALPFKEVSADNIVASLEHMRAPQIFPGYAQWATVFGERFVDPLVRGTGTAEELAPEVRPMLEDVLADSAR